VVALPAAAAAARSPRLAPAACPPPGPATA
jgi:hypothetical protein